LTNFYINRKHYATVEFFADGILESDKARKEKARK
jgi:hypothetical protein